MASVKAEKVTSFSLKFMAIMDGIAAFVAFIAFCLIISILELSKRMNRLVSKEVTNYDMTFDILIAAAVITMLTVLILIFMTISAILSSSYNEKKDEELEHILKPKMLGENQKRKWTFAAFQEEDSGAKMLGEDQKRKWTIAASQDSKV